MKASRAAGRRVDAQLVEYLVVLVPDHADFGGVLDAVESVASSGTVIVLDGAIVAHDRSGALSITELPGSPRRPSLHDTCLGVLSERDLERIAEAIQPGAVGVVLVVEDEWARPLADAARVAGGQIAGGERIPSARLQAVLPQLGSPRRGGS